FVLVDPENDGDVLALRRRADDDLLGTGGEVCAGLLGIGEDAGGLEHDVDAQVGPRQDRRVLLLEHLDLAPVDDQRVVRMVDRAGIGAVRRVVLEQQRIQARLDEVVHGHDLEVRRSLDDGLEGLAADAAEAVDSDANGHAWVPPGTATGRAGRFVVGGEVWAASGSRLMTRGCAPARDTSPPRPAGTTLTCRAITSKTSVWIASRISPSNRSPSASALDPP